MSDTQFRDANPDNRSNQRYLEITRMQLQQARQLAQEVAGNGGAELVPALLIALALNRHASETEPKR
jgi:hypothetical protein